MGAAAAAAAAERNHLALLFSTGGSSYGRAQHYYTPIATAPRYTSDNSQASGLAPGLGLGLGPRPASVYTAAPAAAAKAAAPAPPVPAAAAGAGAHSSTAGVAGSMGGGHGRLLAGAVGDGDGVAGRNGGASLAARDDPLESLPGQPTALAASGGVAQLLLPVPAPAAAAGRFNIAQVPGCLCAACSASPQSARLAFITSPSSYCYSLAPFSTPHGPPSPACCSPGFISDRCRQAYTLHPSTPCMCMCMNSTPPLAGPEQFPRCVARRIGLRTAVQHGKQPLHNQHCPGAARAWQHAGQPPLRHRHGRAVDGGGAGRQGRPRRQRRCAGRLLPRADWQQRQHVCCGASAPAGGPGGAGLGRRRRAVPAPRRTRGPCRRVGSGRCKRQPLPAAAAAAPVPCGSGASWSRRGPLGRARVCSCNAAAPQQQHKQRADGPPRPWCWWRRRGPHRPARQQHPVLRAAAAAAGSNEPACGQVRACVRNAARSRPAHARPCAGGCSGACTRV